MRCHHWENGNRCNAQAEYWLHDEENIPIPAGWECQQHAQEVIDELWHKLGWKWTAIPVDDWGRPQTNKPILEPGVKEG